MKSARERREASDRLFPLAVLVFVLAGVVLQYAILMSGYWQTLSSPRVVPVRTIIPMPQGMEPGSAPLPAQPTPKLPQPGGAPQVTKSDRV